MTERLHFHFSLSCIGEGNGNPLQCSCLENPRDGAAWWDGVAQSRTQLQRLSSSSSNHQDGQTGREKILCSRSSHTGNGEELGFEPSSPISVSTLGWCHSTSVSPIARWCPPVVPYISSGLQRVQSTVLEVIAMRWNRNMWEQLLGTMQDHRGLIPTVVGSFLLSFSH